MEENKKSNNNSETIDYRFLARIVIEASTPLAIHSGDKEVQTDAVVIKDVNGLPYIPGSSIAGVIRHAWKDAGNDIDQLFGFQKTPKDSKNKNAKKDPEEEKNPKMDGKGSRIIISEARILNSTGIVVDGLNSDEISKDPLLKDYINLPIRQHVRITHRGVASDKGKFNEQVVYTGTRFCFEMEMIGTEIEKGIFASLLSILYRSSFRLGSGSRKGFGKIEVIEIKYDALPLKDTRYLEKSADLEKSKTWYTNSQKLDVDKSEYHYECQIYKLRPANFFLFGSGYGDDDADMTPVKEPRVVWKNGASKLKDVEYLIPATSVKGALAHRTAFHYNRLNRIFADGKTDRELEANSGKNNKAVHLLFGAEGNEKGEGRQRGNVIISDMYLASAQDKVLNHVSIDRFTGGAIDGALFSEKVAFWYGNSQEDYPLRLEVLVDKENIKAENKEIMDKALEAFNLALDDLCNGLLPLGGGVNRGNGIFNGKKCD